MEEKGIRQGATRAKALWQAVVRFTEEQGKAGRAREWRVPGTAGDARLRGRGGWRPRGRFWPWFQEHWEAAEALSRDITRDPHMGLPSQASDLHDSKKFSTWSGFKICCCEAGLLKAILFPSSVRACLGPRSLVLATRVSCGPIPCSGPRPPSPHPLRAVRGASHTLP